MKRRLRVYMWRSFRSECPPASNGSQQTSEMLAATSMKEVARIAGVKGPWALDCLVETGSAEDVRLATSTPGVIYWRPINSWRDWRKAGVEVER